MKRNLALLAIFVCSTPAMAGEFFGIVTQGGKPVAKARVEIAIADKSYGADTDATGSYRVVVPEAGKATLTVKIGAQAPAMNVFSSDRALRYDLEVDSGPPPTLRRK